MYRYNKFKNKKTKVDGITFDSQKEANRYLELKLLLKTGKIRELKLQPTYILQDSFKIENKTIRAIKYIADFEYKTKDGKLITEDVKGIKTDVYRIKKKLFEKKYRREIKEIQENILDKIFLKKVIKNYKRNKKRIREIERDYYGTSGIDYTTMRNAQKTGIYDETPAKVEAFERNKERIKLQKEIDAVDRMLLKLNEEQEKIYQYYFLQNKTYRWIEINQYISKSRAQRETYKILNILEEEYF